MTSPATNYAHALDVAGLSAERQARLLAHIDRLNVASAREAHISAAVARSAAALLAADPDRLSGPTAVAQAEALAQVNDLGPALMQIQAGVLALEAVTTIPERVAAGPHTAALRRILWHLIGASTALLEQLGQS